VDRKYIPAAGHRLLLPLYDPLQRLLGSGAALGELIAAAAVEPGQRLLDIGCGTGSLLVELGRRHPGAELFGIDPDPTALARARSKAARAGVAVTLEQGFSDRLPYADGCFDRVFSSFMFHHLGREEKAATLAEARRVLAPGGELHLLDFAMARERPAGFVARWLHAHQHLADNRSDHIVRLLTEAGFTGAREHAHRNTWLGRLGRFRAGVGGAAPPVP